MSIVTKDTSIADCDFLAGTTLLVNKPLNWTSFDVVNKIRFRLKHRLGVKKIKVGHAGTLDPLATGLLIICTGKFTKKIEQYQGQDKEYTGTITLGGTTASYDKEQPVDKIFPTEHINEALLEKKRQQFLGLIKQLPPIYSAIKVDGVPLYKKARKGIAVEVKAREVTIHDFLLERIDLPEVDFKVCCSKGTYIRSLAYDYGKALDSGAYLSALCRTRIGEFPLEKAWEIEDLVSVLEQ